ncbi:MAG: anthranilate synthase component I family protein [Eggerthellaceae bacterium]|nr:anthranilate synthase component I family protein [Eggerthellaceae bacterium]
MLKPSLEEVRELAASGDFRRVPVYTEIYSDVRTPIEVMRILQGVSDHCYMLESAEPQQSWGRYTFLGYDPSVEVTVRDGVLKIDGEETPADDPVQSIRELLAAYRAARLPELPPFAGGLVGYFSYDFLKYAEPTLNLDARDDEGFNDVDLMLFEQVIAFDNYRQKIVLIDNVDVGDLDASYAAADRTLRKLSELIRTGMPVVSTFGKRTSGFRRLFDDEGYCDIVRRAQEHIREGDIFQVVLSNRLDADFEGSLLDTYRVLRATNPSPYMFYFSSADIELAGASPETLVQLKDGVLHTFPLAGTRPRGATEAEDAALEENLLADEKELAEHNMLVDLGRNDLGRISEFGSVQLESYHEVLKFSHVMHIGSTVRGQIRPDKDALDALASVLPAGTLSGAPKIRAAQIINDLEDCKRGIYGGAIGYIDLAGNMDTCIAIRLAFKRNGRVFVRSGAGIVADSVPESENRECMNKAQAVLDALDLAEGGLE